MKIAPSLQKKDPHEAPVTAFLTAKGIYLRPLMPADANGPYPAWLNDAEVCSGNSHHRYPYSSTAAAKFIENTENARDRMILAIIESNSGLHIGNIALQNIDSVNRSAEIAILIGHKASWGKGYGTVACRLLIGHAFDTLNLRRIYCGTFRTNHGMQKVALSVGMQLEGTRREAVYKDGQYIDVLEYGILRHESGTI